MIVMQGKGVSKGVANGKLYFYRRVDTTVTMQEVEDVEAEKARFAAAQEKALEQLKALGEKAAAEAGEEAAMLMIWDLLQLQHTKILSLPRFVAQKSM